MAQHHPGVSNLSTSYHRTNYPWPDLSGIPPSVCILETTQTHARDRVKA